MNNTDMPVFWALEIQEWTTALRAVHLSPRTVELRRYHLRRLARASLEENPWRVDRRQLLVWAGSHAWKRETARAMRSSLRKFWEWGVATGRTTENIADILPPITPEQPRPRPAEPKTVASAVNSSDPRIVLMIRLANELGMRRAEVAQVHPTNDLIREGAGWSLTVHGKGSRRRVLPLPADLAVEMMGAGDGYLFPSPNGGHLSPHWVGTLVSRALSDGTTMHQLRHLCATEIHNQTHDVRLVQTVLGHASLATTQRYLAVDDAQVREAILARSRKWHVAK